MTEKTLKTLIVGDKAPDFTLFTDSRSTFELSKAIAGSPVVLLFFPAAFTGTCTTELNEVNNDLESYSPATVVGISTDAPFTLTEYKKVNGFTYSLLSDHDAEVCKAYGSKYDHGFTGMKLDRIAKRSAFVVDQSGIIRYAEVLENASHVPNLVAIKAVLSAL
ncbi:MAG: redoxin domain-containing protein [Bacteroidetes bacterium]|nr:redoxin domain-containing protein [Bacteroidota bacterium]